MNAAVGTEWFLPLWKPGVSQKRNIRGQSQELYSSGKTEKYEAKEVSTF